MFDAPVFIDFEASSLSDDSWPIKVGMSWTDGKRVITHSSLIRPRHDWSSTEWDEGSAKVHNIPKRNLIAAPEADLVARWLEDLIDGRPLVSDAPSFDERWLRLQVGPQDWCRVHSMDVALEMGILAERQGQPREAWARL